MPSTGHRRPVIRSVSRISTPSNGTSHGQNLHQIGANHGHSTNSALPYCYSYLIPSISAIGFNCESTFSSDFAILETTFAGEVDGRTWLPLYETASAAPSIFNGFSTVQTSSISIGSLSTPAPTTSTTPTPTPQKSSSSSNAGPIAGGVVGGLIVIGAAAVGITFLLRRRGGSAGAAAPGGGQYSDPTAPQPPPMAAAAVAPGFANDPRYSTASYYKPPEGPGVNSPSYAGSPPPTYGVPGAPQELQYNPAQQQQYPPPQQAYSPQQQYGQQQQGPPQPAVSPVQQGAAAVQNPWGPPPPQQQQPPPQQQQQQPLAHELGGGSAYPLPTTTAEGQPIYEAAGGHGA
jgi:hypothetical protein